MITEQQYESEYKNKLMQHNLTKRAVSKINCELSGSYQTYYKEYQELKKEEDDQYILVY